MSIDTELIADVIAKAIAWEKVWTTSSLGSEDTETTIALVNAVRALRQAHGERVSIKQDGSFDITSTER